MEELSSVEVNIFWESCAMGFELLWCFAFVTTVEKMVERSFTFCVVMMNEHNIMICSWAILAANLCSQCQT